MSASDDSTYRVTIARNKKSVSVECFGMYPLDRSIDGTYASVDELPEWMQSKLAVLIMLSTPPPTNDGWSGQQAKSVLVLGIQLNSGNCPKVNGVV